MLEASTYHSNRKVSILDLIISQTEQSHAAHVPIEMIEAVRIYPLIEAT